MSILEDQLIGSGKLTALATNERNPFPKAPEWDGTPSVGFGGYTYANDMEQAELFANKANYRRVGPIYYFHYESADSPRYGGAAGARPTKYWNTVLGQLGAIMIGTRKWQTGLRARQIKHSIMNSGELKSVKDKSSTTVTGGSIPNASGGAFKGYDDDNKYGISNWDTDQINVVTNRAATTAELAEAVDSDGSLVTAITLKAEGVNEVASQELFRPTDDINTGLRNLPK
tara:strand:- start:83 stop:769 length:687 start_codon:yes stop_codon:yes gene_type:complete